MTSNTIIFGAKPSNKSIFSQEFDGFEASQSMSGKLQERGMWGIYFWTNETFSGTLTQLKKLPPKGDTIIGVSGLFNLALYLARENKGIKYVVNIDPAECYPIFWELVEKAFKKANSPIELEKILVPALDAAKNKLFAERRYLVHLSDFKEKGQFAQMFSILYNTIFQSQEQFNKLKSLFSENRFVHIPVDLADANKATALKKRLEEHGHAPDIFYFSNVEEYMGTLQHQIFLKNIEILSSNKTAHILDSCTSIDESRSCIPLLKQRLNGNFSL